LKKNEKAKTVSDQSIEVAAEYYHNVLGLAVLGFYIGSDGKKHPAIDSWGKWQKEPQSDNEFKEQLPKVMANRLMGIVTGTKTKPINNGGENGEYYVAVVDRDTKDPDVTRENMKIAKKACGQMRTTKIEETMSRPIYEEIGKGEHRIYFSKMPCKGRKYKKYGLELLGLGNLCVMYPSEGYRETNDNAPTVVANVEDMFNDAIEASGIDKRAKNPSTTGAKTYRKKKLRPCFEKLIEKDHIEHHQKVALVYELYYCGRSEEEVKELFQEHKSWEPEPNHTYNSVETEKQIAYTIGKAKTGAYRYLKTTLEELGICDPTCPLHVLPDCRKKPEQRETIEPIAEIAKPIESKHRFVVEKTSKILYVYDPEEGIYTSDTEDLINKEICKLLDDDTRIKYYKDVDNWIRHNEKTLRVTFNSDNNLVAMANGILNLDTGQLSQFSPEFLLTNKIPHDYIENANYSEWTKFLEQVLPNESQRKQLQEIIGKTLARLNRIHHIILILCGEGNNGKSVFFDVITAWLGRKNVSMVTLQALANDKFERAKIGDKLANIVSDLPTELLKHMGTINMISAGDNVTLQDKYKDPYEHQSNISLMFACNEAPKIDSTEDHTGTYRRIVLIDFPITFSPNDPKHPEDKHLREILCNNETLMAGITNWAIEGLKRLKNQKDLTDRPSVQDTRQAYIKRSDSCHAFIIDKLTDTADYENHIFDDLLYREYIGYCVNNKLTRHTKGELTKAINQHLPGAERTQVRVNPDDPKNKDRKRAWRFLKYKNAEQAQIKGGDEAGKIDNY
jgi:P4 family phage/plasmid primase-like protien